MLNQCMARRRGAPREKVGCKYSLFIVPDPALFILRAGQLTRGATATVTASEPSYSQILSFFELRETAAGGAIEDPAAPAAGASKAFPTAIRPRPKKVPESKLKDNKTLGGVLPWVLETPWRMMSMKQ